MTFRSLVMLALAIGGLLASAITAPANAANPDPDAESAPLISRVLHLQPRPARARFVAARELLRDDALQKAQHRAALLERLLKHANRKMLEGVGSDPDA